VITTSPPTSCRKISPPAAPTKAAERECYCPVKVALLKGAKHCPQREALEATLQAIAEFVGRVTEAKKWTVAA
jgi:hypothetical protein